jgi:hypothetical protein
MARSRIRLCVAAGVIYFGRAIAAEPVPAEPAADGAGVWVLHTYSFVHLGVTSTYSCSGLADKLTDLLRAAGARDDVKARPGGCADGFSRPLKLARVDLTFHTLQPAGGATPVASAGANPPGASAVTDNAVPATWRPVVIEPRTVRNLERGDCELVEEFRDWLLPSFTTRDVKDGLSCQPYSLSSGLSLRFESYGALPPPPATAPAP